MECDIRPSGHIQVSSIVFPLIFVLSISLCNIRKHCVLFGSLDKYGLGYGNDDNSGESIYTKA